MKICAIFGDFSTRPRPLDFWYNKSGQSYSDIMAKECYDQGINHSLICEAIKD